MGERIGGGAGPRECRDDLQVGSRGRFLRAVCGEIEGLLAGWCDVGWSMLRQCLVVHSAASTAG